MNYTDLAKSEYYTVLKEDLEQDLMDLQQPPEQPITSLVEANVIREKILWIKSKLRKLELLRNQTDDKKIDDSYE